MVFDAVNSSTEEGGFTLHMDGLLKLGGKHIQGVLASAVNEQIVASAAADLSLPIETRARILSATQPCVADCFAISAIRDETEMSDEVFSHAVFEIIGHEQLILPPSWRCHCVKYNHDVLPVVPGPLRRGKGSIYVTEQWHANGYHLTSCGVLGHRTQRHNHVNVIIGRDRRSSFSIAII